MRQLHTQGALEILICADQYENVEMVESLKVFPLVWKDAVFSYRKS
jgi:hypothetical protein